LVSSELFFLGALLYFALECCNQFVARYLAVVVVKGGLGFRSLFSQVGQH
jgi:hypothetical protein